MANISEVDYEAIPSQASAMREEGKLLNNEITAAYDSIQNMHEVWHGERYNSLVTEFNNIIPQINELLKLVVGEIPFALETVANNYSQADKGVNVTSASRTDPTKIANIPTPRDVGLKFITGSVEETQKSVSNNFLNAKEKMATIESYFNKITWKSEAATEFKNKFSKLKRDIDGAFDDIERDFSKLMGQTLSDMQGADDASNVNK